MFGGSYEQNTTFDAVPEGRYVCALDNCVIQETKSGTPYLQMTFIIQGGEHDKRKLWHKLWFTEKAYNMTAQQLDNIYVFKRIAPTQTIEEFMNAAAGLVFELLERKFEVEVQGHDEYNGKLYPKTFLTHYMDVPNHAVQIFPATPAQAQGGQKSPPKYQPRVHNAGQTSAPAPQANMSPAPTFDANEEIPNF